MIGSLRGTLVTKSASEVIVEACGVGYLLSVPAGTLSGLPAEGREVFLHVHTHVREDAIQLYGFLTPEEKRTFRVLLGVSGVGPKVALSVVSSVSQEDFLRAVESEDVELLTRVPGLGKKTAQRLVLELKGKLPSLGAARDRVFEDTLSALLNLGYRKAEAAEALEKARRDGHDGIESLLRESLKYLTGVR